MSPDPIETLIVLAAPNEVTAALEAFDVPGDRDVPSGAPVRLSGGTWAIETGIGSANAAARTAAFLAHHLPKRVISLGLAGALPGGGLEIGDAVLARRSVFADVGIETPDGFLDTRAMGFPLYEEDDGEGIPPDEGLCDALLPIVDDERVIATVSTCSGTDEGAERVRRRTGAAAENMEGAAVLLACRHAGVPGAEIRVISNTAGDRAEQRWDIGRALARLGEMCRLLSEASIS